MNSTTSISQHVVANSLLSPSGPFTTSAPLAFGQPVPRPGQSARPEFMTTGDRTASATGHGRALTPLSTVCGPTNVIAKGEWFYAPKHGNDVHFQRLRCVP